MIFLLGTGSGVMSGVLMVFVLGTGSGVISTQDISTLYQ